MVLGQIVAISFSSSLFLALIDEPAPAALPSLAGSKFSRKANLSSINILYLTVAISLGTVFFVPESIGTGIFLSILLAMHAIILLPLLELASSNKFLSTSTDDRNAYVASGEVSVPNVFATETHIVRLYVITTTISLFAHLKTSLPLLFQTRGDVRQLALLFWSTLNCYPAQSSISWDILWVNAIWQIWACKEIWKYFTGRRAYEILMALTFVSMTPILGAAVSSAAFLALREGRLSHGFKKTKVT